MSDKKRTLLISGSFPAPLSEKEGEKLVAILKCMMWWQNVTIIDASGNILKDYIQEAATAAAEHKKKDIYTFCIPWNDSMSISKDVIDLAVIIGGSNKDTATRLWYECRRKNIPLLGAPMYSGTGHDAYMELMMEPEKYFPNLHESNKEKLLTTLLGIHHDWYEGTNLMKAIDLVATENDQVEAL